MPTKTYVLEFRDEKSVHIRLDVNNCVGNYEMSEEGKIIFSPLGCTKICCDSDFALSLASILPQMTTFLVKDDTLLLAGEGRMLLERMD